MLRQRRERSSRRWLRGEGKSLYARWPDGMHTMHGFMVHDFPNLILVGGLFAFSLGANYCSSVNEQARHAAYIVAELGRRGVASAEPTLEAEDAWKAEQLVPWAGPSAPVSRLFV